MVPHNNRRATLTILTIPLDRPLMCKLRTLEHIAAFDWAIRLWKSCISYQAFPVPALRFLREFFVRTHEFSRTCLGHSPPYFLRRSLQ